MIGSDKTDGLAELLIEERRDRAFQRLSPQQAENYIRLNAKVLGWLRKTAEKKTAV